jgi:hemerythrin-like domain-containing protein
MVDFISGYTDGFHHLKEESYLFPALQSHGIQRHGGALGLIEQEHENEREVTEGMRLAIEGYKGVDPEARQRFVEAAHRYSDLLLPHIEHEDSMLFRIADELLDEEQIKLLSEAFKQTAAELGADRVEVYEKMAAELEETWGI